MSKHIFSKIAKIGEEVRSAEAIKVELNALQDLKQANVDLLSVMNKAKSIVAELKKLSAIKDEADKILVDLTAEEKSAIKIGYEYKSQLENFGITTDTHVMPPAYEAFWKVANEAQDVKSELQKAIQSLA